MELMGSLFVAEFGPRDARVDIIFIFIGIFIIVISITDSTVFDNSVYA